MEPTEPVGSNPASGRAYLLTASKADTKRLVALGYVVPWVAAGPPGTGPAERHQSHRQGTRRSGGTCHSACHSTWRYSVLLERTGWTALLT
jgi:hypothetical protein